ncbi:MAG: ACT domain-containing protein [Clostridia bacterium]|nr:ACT domain-containing protein [Clostridia bacterium]MBQ8971900.1 ACT domain-containing protein [Clostridia bacterium]
MNEQKKAVISILGADRKGIIAQVTRILYDYDVNILDISQTIVSGLFSMILIADISSEHCPFEALKNSLAEEGQRLNVQIRVQRSEIFEAMHQI